MATEVQQRYSCFKKLSKLLTDVDTNATTALTLTEVECFLETGKKTIDKLDAFHEKIIAVCVSEAEVDVQESTYAPMLDLYQEIRVKLLDIKKEILKNNPTTPAPTSSFGSHADVKLPRLELPFFNGSFDKWTSFKDLFLATIDTNRSLQDAQKLQYLKSAVKDEPESLIRSLQVTNANYKEAWDLLNARYDNEREIITSLLKRLFEPKPLINEAAADLQKLLDNTMECVRALRVVKVPIEHWDHILVYFTVKKLDSNTRREWAIKLTGTISPTFKELSDFMENHIRGLLASGASNQKSTLRHNRQHVATHHSSADKCPICNGEHFIQKCESFISKSPAERSALIKQHYRCYNCLRKDHRINECKSPSRCRKCGKKHHTFLHVDRAGDGQHKEPPPPPPQADKPPVLSHHAHSSQADTQVLLSTAVVKVKSRSNGDQYVRVLFDSGSEGTFITEECVRLLGLKRHASSIQVKGVSSTTIGTTRGLVNCTLWSRLTNDSCTIAAHILPRVTGFLPRYNCSPVWPHLQGFELADPKFNEPGPVDILLGADYSAAIMKQAKVIGPLNSPIAQDSMFGWVLTGRVTISDQIIQSHHVEVEVDNILQRFWTVEEPPHSKILTKDEKECESIFTQHVSRSEDGRYIVPTPFNGRQTQLGPSRSTAVRRFLQVERRLQRNQDYRKQYNEFMDEYLNLGHMEKIPDDEAKEEVGASYYLPHHFVLNSSSSTTKFRVVFDGSAATPGGLSLNDTMFVGATLQDDLYSLLLRFRTHNIVLKADIAKMFRQFRLKKEEADYHRIVWRDTPTQQIADYRLLTVTYGTACAPFLSTRCLQELAKDCSSTHPIASKVINDDLYVDDVLTGTSTADDGIKLYHELSDAVSTAKLELRKWTSNDATVLAAIPEHLRETNPLTFDKNDSIKALGVQWHPVQDSFSFNKFEMQKYEILTKRILLSDLARVFDPLGFLSAVTIRAKLIMQELWKLSIGWDEAVPPEFQQQWMEYCSELEDIPHIIIPRCITTPTHVSYELHGFCDASEKAYGGIIYLRTINADGSASVSFVTSKSKVAPIKQLTLARLELCGAVLLSRLIIAVKQALKLSCEVYAWCDATIVLRWIAAHPRRWQTFVANRVAQIQENVPVECWRHVPGLQNPADLVSRGITVNQVINNKFLWTGPDWLSYPQLPLFTPDVLHKDSDLEERKLKLQSNLTEFSMSLLERFSSLTKLKRVTAFMLRFINNMKTKPPQLRQSGFLSTTELKLAILVWVREVQQHDFATEIHKLKKGQPIPSSSKLNQLHPYLDHDGVLRVGGRLQHAALPERKKHQIILPKRSHLTTLLILSTHQQYLHSGFQMTWSVLLTEFWILQGRDMVRFLVRKCVTCRKHRAAAAEQLMGQLPAARVTPARPFINTGVDYAGPFFLKNMKGRSKLSYKAYLCVFVCMVTKAVHLEAVSELSTGAFIATLRRFVARRGLCSNLFSDCGSNFVGADRELQQLLKTQQHYNEITDNLSTNGISWHFNSPSAPHHGGLWEAAVKSAKFHLKRIMNHSIFTFEQFQTVLCQVEAVLNSRPLYAPSSDPNDLNPLTPGHFLIGEPLIAVPDEPLDGVKENRLGVWQRQQLRVQHFWRRWSHEYLNTLQQRQKWRKEQANLQVGDMVIIKDDATAPGHWKIGRILETHPGDDGKTRVVTIKTSTSSLKRPIQKLIPLLIEN